VAALEGKRVVEVSCGAYHTSARTDAGRVYTFGAGSAGALGNSFILIINYYYYYYFNIYFYIYIYICSQDGSERAGIGRLDRIRGRRD
jgi:hypothetical protein